MNRIITFRKNQIKNVLKNKNVLSFCGKYIVYSKDFKIRAVDQYLNKGMSSHQIFEQAGFDLNLIGRKRPIYLLHDWIKILQEKGVGGFDRMDRGKGRKMIKTNEKLTDEEKIKKLELEILYLKKENDFLAKLRAKKAE